MKHKIIALYVIVLLLIICLACGDGGGGGGVDADCKARVFTECTVFGADAQTCEIMARKTCD